MTHPHPRQRVSSHIQHSLTAELVAAGAEMVSGNLDDPASYEAHLKGAHGVFLATNCRCPVRRNQLTL